jgi:tRNA-modifying protein YgfZ
MEPLNIGGDDNRRVNPTSLLDGVTQLHDWGVIRARGTDATPFLHGQLTSDTAQLGLSRARLAGYCSAKGRLLASFIVWRSADNDLLLACSADLLAPTLKRLRMFVLRAKCVLSDASAELPLFGLAGPQATAWLADAAPSAVWDKCERVGLTAIRLPDAAGQARYLCTGEVAPQLPPLPLEVWRWLELRSGVARIEQATIEQFVPQMLNFEVLGGVDFQKGCYPGQEVVARSQYRGSVKRRSFLFETDAPASAGEDVFHSDDASQPAGKVANAAALPAGYPPGSLALVEVKLAALAGGSLHLGAADGPVLRQIDLPYELPLDAAVAD